MTTYAILQDRKDTNRICLIDESIDLFVKPTGAIPILRNKVEFLEENDWEDTDMRIETTAVIFSLYIVIEYPNILVGVYLNRQAAERHAFHGYGRYVEEYDIEYDQCDEEEPIHLDHKY
tara:strand:+ start:484 stop:840 length:357 start_codon:yes stop_codon:yes gene_type:complete